MLDIREKVTAGRPDLDTVSRVCAALLASLPRADQRRKGELYVRGLLTAPGRKTMRNLAGIADEPAAAQSMHHFISCSTWDWAAVRAALAGHLDRMLSPRAWVVRSMLVPKTGRHSIGVERRYVPALGETVNSQQSYGLWLASEAAAAPVNWQLSIGKGWLQENGARANVPEDEDGTTGDGAAVQAVLKAAAWGIGPRPVVMDARHSALPPLIEAFTTAGLPFLLRINGGCTLLAAGSGPRGSRVAAAPAEHLLGLARAQRRPVEWIDPASPGARRTSLVAPLQVYWPGLPGSRPPGQSAPAPPATARAAALGLPLTLLGKWQTYERGVQQVWLTNMTDAGYGPLLRLSKLTRRVETDFSYVSLDVGIQDFEGRSYQGWHRHVTLASVAHALRMLGDGAG
ncbi:transposase [Micromonospora sp. KC207]|uniref:IS701 family transposase n=1 Tax=Micromonospora sp. KC207 TaxID=2530377 RepID=UPI0014043C56|nr:transposase [Micromonospora sp. KC207]